MGIHYINQLAWPEISNLDNETTLFILPISSLEQHGHHLPLGTDDYILNYCIDNLVNNCTIENETLIVLPTLHYGASVEHLSFPGTVSLKPTTLMTIVHDIIESLNLHGFDNFMLLNSHGGNTSLLKSMAQDLRFRLKVSVFNIDLWDSDFFEPVRDIIQTDIANDIHAGEIETSLIKYAYPELVKDRQCSADDLSSVVNLNAFDNCWLSSDLTESGIIGDATAATAEKGREIAGIMTDKLNQIVNQVIKCMRGV